MAGILGQQQRGNAFLSAVRGSQFVGISLDVIQIHSSHIEPNFGPDRKGDIKHSNADISKAQRLLGYDPDYDFAKGLNEAIEWYKNNL